MLSLACIPLSILSTGKDIFEIPQAALHSSSILNLRTVEQQQKCCETFHVPFRSLLDTTHHHFQELLILHLAQYRRRLRYSYHHCRLN